MITLIAAMTREHIIGNKGKLPWDIPADLQHFRDTTKGHTIIMGKTTYESIGRPLPNRTNIVISSSMPKTEGIEVCRSLEEALERGHANTEEVFIIGGASVYEQALPLADKLIITHIEHNYPGDARFPAFSEKEWHKLVTQKGQGFTIVTYTRKNHEHAR